LAEPLLRQFIETKSFALDVAGIAAGTGFALLIAIAILPAVYKNAFDPDKPVLVQLCALFASGLGWRSLFLGRCHGDPITRDVREFALSA
jgi:hypothetical protein